MCALAGDLNLFVIRRSNGFLVVIFLWTIGIFDTFPLKLGKYTFFLLVVAQAPASYLFHASNIALYSWWLQNVNFTRCGKTARPNWPKVETETKSPTVRIDKANEDCLFLRAFQTMFHSRQLFTPTSLRPSFPATSPYHSKGPEALVGHLS